MTASTEKLIYQLVDDLKPSPFIRPSLKTVLWGGFSVISILFSFLLLQGTPIWDSISSVSFLQGMVLLVGAFLSNYGVMKIKSPERQIGRFLPASIIFVSTVYLVWKVFETPLFYSPDVSGWGCVKQLLLFSVLPAAGLWILLKRGIVFRKTASMVLGISAVGAMASVGLHFSCASIEIGHLLSYHFGPIGAALLVGVGFVNGLSKRSLK